MNIDRLAEIVFRARKSSRKSHVSILEAEPGLGLEQALAVQIAAKRLQENEGDRIVGYQASFTSAAAQKLVPTMPVPMVGTLMRSMIRESGASFDCGTGPTLIECEVGAILSKDLRGPNLAPIEVLAAVHAFVPMVEVTPVEPEQIEGKWANQDLIVSQKPDDGYVFVGNTITQPFDFDPILEGVTLIADGRVQSSAVGVQSMGNPLSVIAAIARRLNDIGEGLEAGQLVMTGSLTPPMVVEDKHHLLEARFTRLGSVHLIVTPPSSK